MSLAYRCNRCAALFDPNDPRADGEHPPIELRALPIKRPKGGIEEQVTSVPAHLCGSCTAAFSRFLSRKPIEPADPRLDRV